MKLFLLPFFLICHFSYGYKIIIDPGHGGSDHGAVRKHVKESQITLKISKKLYKLLQNNPHFFPFLTRTDDQFIPLKERAEFANKNQGDLFVSIHANSSLDKKAKGAEIYFQNQLPPDEEALFLANRENIKNGPPEGAANLFSNTPRDLPKNVYNIVEDLKRNMRIRHSGEFSKIINETWSGLRKKHRKNSIRQAPFYVISNVNMPSVLIELGFLTNPKEAKLLKDNAYQNKIARSIYQSIIKFKETMDKRSESSLH